MKALIRSINTDGKTNLRTLESPVLCYIKITSCCMLKCSFCSQSEQVKETMPLEDVKMVLDKLKKEGLATIIYTGGEPLMHNHIVEILKYGKSLGFEQVLVTNLLNLRVNDNEQVLNYINSLGVSLHGVKEVHDKLSNQNGVFDKVVSNIDYVLNNYKNVKVNLNCTLTDMNSNEENMEFLLDFAKKRDIALSLGRLNYIGAGLKYKLLDMSKFLPLVERLKEKYSKIDISNCIARCAVNEKNRYMLHGCGVGVSMISINPNCDVTICPSSSKVLGNLKEKKFKKIWNCKYLQDYRDLKWVPMICKLCKEFESCKGGCHSEESQCFWKDNCDSLVTQRLNKAWNEIEDNKLKLHVSNFRIDGNEYVILKSRVRKTNKIGFEILKSVDGSKTGRELVNGFSKVENIKEFLTTAYIDGILEVRE